MWKTTILITAVFLASCGGGDEGWVCKINGGNMYSIGPSGNLEVLTRLECREQ